MWAYDLYSGHGCIMGDRYIEKICISSDQSCQVEGDICVFNYNLDIIHNQVSIGSVYKDPELKRVLCKL